MDEDSVTTCDALLGYNSTSVCGTVFDSFEKDPLFYDGIRNIAEISYGIPNFDSFPNGLVTVFQVLTLEGWSQMLYNYQDAGDPKTAIVFFALVVIIGAFFSLNLFLASIMESFAKQQAVLEDMKRKEEEEQIRQEREKKERIRLGLDWQTPRDEVNMPKSPAK